MKEAQKIATEMVEKIRNFPVGTKFTIKELVKTIDESHDFSDVENTFAIMEQFLKRCEQEDIVIENTQANQFLGMPWVYIYIKK
jgi:hypothetical protein